MLRSMRSRVTFGVSLFALAVLVMTMNMTHAQDETSTGAQAASKVRVGTYEADQVLHGFHETQKFIAFVQGLEEQAMAAQQAGDHARLMEMQMEAQQREQAVLQSFQFAVDRAMPKIAQEHNLQIVALELIYHDSDIEPRDITDEVIREINADAAVEEAPDADDE